MPDTPEPAVPGAGGEAGPDKAEKSAPGPNGRTVDAERWLSPLSAFYARSGLELPATEPVDPDALPAASRTLLVHEGDMTSTLRRFHGSEIGLRVCAASRDAGSLGRLVVLYRKDTGRPVEFGAINITLDRLPEAVRERVVAGAEPLGGILEACRFPFQSRPRGFFRFDADPFIGVLLAQPIRHRLFGRCNVLATAEGETFAEIVEILPEESPSPS